MLDYSVMVPMGPIGPITLGPIFDYNLSTNASPIFTPFSPILKNFF